MTAVDDLMTENEMATEITEDDSFEIDAEYLVEYAVDLLKILEPAELAQVERTYAHAVTLARAYQVGLIDADGITDFGYDHLADLYNDFEHDGENVA